MTRRTRWIALSLLLGSSLSGGCGSDTEPAAPARERVAPDTSQYPEALQSGIGLGIAHLQNDRIQEAIVQFEETARQFPEQGIAHHWVAMAYSQVDQINRSLESWRRAEELGYDTAELRQGRARAYRLRKEFEPALEEIEIALEYEPENLEFAYWQSFTLYKLQRFDEAQAVLEDIVARAPTQTRAWMLLGRCRLALYDPKGALQAFRRVIAFDSGHEGARLEIATLLGREGDWSGVAKTLEPLVLGRPGSAQVHFKLSTAYQRLGKDDLARRHRQIHEQLREQERADKQRQVQQHAAFFELGRAAMERKDWESALERFERILELDPDNAEAQKLVERVKQLQRESEDR